MVYDGIRMRVHLPEYQNKYWCVWVGYMGNSLQKNSPARDRMHKQFTRYLLPFLINTNTSETTYVEQLACREDGWHTATIASCKNI